MANVFEIHTEECRAAMVAQNEAIKAAQKTYGETLDQSRGRAWDTIQKRLSIWNGELPEDLPPASTLETSASGDESLAAFERDPTGGSA
jgi:hypothetical protein